MNFSFINDLRLKIFLTSEMKGNRKIFISIKNEKNILDLFKTLNLCTYRMKKKMTYVFSNNVESSYTVNGFKEFDDVDFEKYDVFILVTDDKEIDESNREKTENKIKKYYRSLTNEVKKKNWGISVFIDFDKLTPITEVSKLIDIGKDVGGGRFYFNKPENGNWGPDNKQNQVVALDLSNFISRMDYSI